MRKISSVFWGVLFIFGTAYGADASSQSSTFDVVADLVVKGKKRQKQLESYQHTIRSFAQALLVLRAHQQKKVEPSLTALVFLRNIEVLRDPQFELLSGIVSAHMPDKMRQLWQQFASVRRDNLKKQSIMLALLCGRPDYALVLNQELVPHLFHKNTRVFACDTPTREVIAATVAQRFASLPYDERVRLTLGMLIRAFGMNTASAVSIVGAMAAPAQTPAASAAAAESMSEQQTRYDMISTVLLACPTPELKRAESSESLLGNLFGEEEADGFVPVAKPDPAPAQQALPLLATPTVPAVQRGMLATLLSYVPGIGRYV